MSGSGLVDWFNAALDNDHRFIKENIDMYARCVDVTKETALMKAARRNCGDVVAILAEHECGSYNNRYENALMLALQNNSVDCLYALCACATEHKMSNGDTPLHYAIRVGCFEAIPHLTSLYKRTYSKAERTPLEFAAELGSVRAIEHLLVYGTPYTQLEVDKAIERARACSQSSVISTLPILFRRYWRIKNARGDSTEPVTVEDLMASEPDIASGEPIVDSLALKSALLSAGVSVNDANSVVRSLSNPGHPQDRSNEVTNEPTEAFTNLTESMRKLVEIGADNHSSTFTSGPAVGPQINASLYQEPGDNGMDYNNFMGIRGRREDESIVSADVVDNIVASKNAEIARLEDSLRDAYARIRMAESGVVVNNANKANKIGPGYIDPTINEYVPGCMQNPLDYCSSKIANDRGNHRSSYRADVPASPGNLTSSARPARSERPASRSGSRSGSRGTSRSSLRSHYGRGYKPEVNHPRPSSTISEIDSMRTSQVKSPSLVQPISKRRIDPGVAGDSDLIIAVKNGDMTKFRKYLTNQAGRVDSQGRSALMHAVDRNNMLMIRELTRLEAGIRDSEGVTALMIAAKLNQPLTVSMLVVHEKRFAKRTDGSTALMAAAANGNIDCVDILARHEKGIQAIDGSTALIHAIRNNRRRCASLLWPFEHSIADKEGMTPRDWAMRFNRQEILRAVGVKGPQPEDRYPGVGLYPSLNPAYLVHTSDDTVNLFNVGK